MKTSLGPKGMDKILIGPDGDIDITNDGATILKELQVDHQIGKLLVDLSQSQDSEIGDGTTSVVVFAGALLEQAEILLEKGIHPSQISSGYDTACQISVEYLNSISEQKNVSPENYEILYKTAQTSLNSKILSKCRDKFASYAVEAILTVADFFRRDVDFDLIKIHHKLGGELSDSLFFKGVVIDKDFSHSQMPKTMTSPNIAILTCPFEPPKPKTKHKLDICNIEEYEKLKKYEKESFMTMINSLKATNCNLAFCQWGFDDEANHLLLANNINAVRWVGGSEIELLSMATGSKIIPRFEGLSADKLGMAGIVKEISLGTAKEKMIVVEDCPNSKVCTIVLRGGNKMIIDEARRSINDALCAVRNLIKDSSVVYGGGSCEVACSIYLENCATKFVSAEMFILEAFAKALDTIPLSLATNSGINSIECLADLKVQQKLTGNTAIGVDCSQFGSPGNFIQSY